jgi:hypothetical protein
VEGIRSLTGHAGEGCLASFLRHWLLGIRARTRTSASNSEDAARATYAQYRSCAAYAEDRTRAAYGQDRARAAYAQDTPNAQDAAHAPEAQGAEQALCT